MVPTQTHTLFPSRYAQAWKIIRLLMIMFLAAHWAGCLFFFMCELQDNGIDEPWCNANEDVVNAEGGTRFLVAFHTAFLMLVGENIDPTTNWEYFYTTMMLVAGQIISAVVIGNISIVLNNQASMSALYMQKMDRVNESMTTLKLPSKIQHKGTRANVFAALACRVLLVKACAHASYHNMPPFFLLVYTFLRKSILSAHLISLNLFFITVRTFYEYMWNRHRVLAGNETFRQDLNSSLRSEVDLYLNRDIVVNNSMFSKVSDSVLIAIVSALKNQVFLRDDFIIRKGQWGSEMFFLLSGKAGARIKGKIVKAYGPGNAFGEVALIEDGGRRKCDVMALTNVDLRVLERAAFDILCGRYPELKARLREEARAYSTKSKNRFKSATTVLAKQGISGLFSTKVAPDGPVVGGHKQAGGALSAYGAPQRALSEPVVTAETQRSGGGLFGTFGSAKAAKAKAAATPSTPAEQAAAAAVIAEARNPTPKEVDDGDNDGAGGHGKRSDNEEGENEDALAPLPGRRKQGVFDSSKKRFTITAQRGDDSDVSKLTRRLAAEASVADQQNAVLEARRAANSAAINGDINGNVIAVLGRMETLFMQLQTQMNTWQGQTDERLNSLTAKVDALAKTA